MAPATKPTLRYFDIGSLGRGEPIRLFFKDVGIEFKDIRIPHDDNWPTVSAELQKKGLSRSGKIPVLEYNDVILTEHVPILRYLARDLGAYDGETNYDKYIVDAVADLYIDWRAQWASGASTDKFKNETAPAYYNVIAQYYADRSGPYLLGDKITYADYLVYESIDNDEVTKSLPAKLPAAIQKFREAFEARPNVAAYLASGRSTSRD
ncbi:glutathione S-transferase [Xylogone sp. PMI_703]|nr:glutathione S-transferase [Xylogone sp. PMI_703]